MVKEGTFKPLLTPRANGLARAHADTLDGLEELAFGFNARRDNDFSFLKSADALSADIAHARGDRADEILRAVIDAGRPVKDLLQRPADADFDSCATRKI